MIGYGIVRDENTPVRMDGSRQSMGGWACAKKQETYWLVRDIEHMYAVLRLVDGSSIFLLFLSGKEGRWWVNELASMEFSASSLSRAHRLMLSHTRLLMP